MNHTFVIQTPTNLLLRYGYCDFTQDGSFNPANETILQKGAHLAPPDFEPDGSVNWYWHADAGEEGQFKTSPPGIGE